MPFYQMKNSVPFYNLPITSVKNNDNNSRVAITPMQKIIILYLLEYKENLRLTENTVNSKI